MPATRCCYCSSCRTPLCFLSLSGSRVGRCHPHGQKKQTPSGKRHDLRQPAEAAKWTQRRRWTLCGKGCGAAWRRARSARSCATLALRPTPMAAAAVSSEAECMVLLAELGWSPSDRTCTTTQKPSTATRATSVPRNLPDTRLPADMLLPHCRLRQHVGHGGAAQGHGTGPGIAAAGAAGAAAGADACNSGVKPSENDIPAWAATLPR